MTAASTSDARKRNGSQVDPVEVVARVIHPYAFEPWMKHSPVAARAAAARIVEALRENGLLA